MAKSHQEAKNRISHLSDTFGQHLMYLVSAPECPAARHWCKEVLTWTAKARSLASNVRYGKGVRAMPVTEICELMKGDLTVVDGRLLFQSVRHHLGADAPADLQERLCNADYRVRLLKLVDHIVINSEELTADTLMFHVQKYFSP
jgi:hypothetical protein